MSSERSAVRLRDWLRLNFEIGALSFGSSGRALLYQEAVVERRQWLGAEDFREIFTLAQVLPGPNLVNLAVYLGYRLTGWKGAILGLVALAAPGALMIIAIYRFLGLESSFLDPLFRGFTIGSVVLFLILIEKTALGLRQSPRGGEEKNRQKVILRFLLAVTIGVLAFRGVEFKLVLAGGALAGLLLEFLPW